MRVRLSVSDLVEDTDSERDSEVAEGVSEDDADIESVGVTVCVRLVKVMRSSASSMRSNVFAIT